MVNIGPKFANRHINYQLEHLEIFFFIFYLPLIFCNGPTKCIFFKIYPPPLLPFLLEIRNSLSFGLWCCIIDLLFALLFYCCIIGFIIALLLHYCLHYCIIVCIIALLLHYCFIVALLFVLLFYCCIIVCIIALLLHCCLHYCCSFEKYSARAIQLIPT